MQIRINGQAQKIRDGLTVASLLDELNADIRQVAVEKNGIIVPRSTFAATAILEGDVIELVEFVGGG